MSDANGRRRILLVEDDDAIRQLVSDVLADAGYEVDAARGGREALARAQEAPPDLIILDKLMPDGDGSMFAAAYAQRHRVRAPIIALCASRDGGEWATSIGAVTLIVKPFDIDVLLETVALHCATPSAKLV